MILIFGLHVPRFLYDLTNHVVESALSLDNQYITWHMQDNQDIR